MKRIVFLSAVLIIFAFLLAGCEKPEPPAPPAVFYTLTTIINGKGSVNPEKLSGIPLGGSSTIKFIPETGFSLYSVKINGVNIEDIQPSTAEVSYTIQNINKNLMVEVVFVETDILIFSVKSTNEKPWMLTRMGTYKADGDVLLGNVNLTQAEKTDRYYFVYPSMETFVYQLDGVIRNGKWNLKQRFLSLGDTETYPVLDLTTTKFVFKTSPYWSNGDSFYIYVVYSFERK